MPPNSNCIALDVTEMPRLRSISIQSLVAARCALRDLTAPACVDRAAVQQQLLGQRGLAGVRVRDDREGAPALRFVGHGRRQACSGCA